MVHNSVLFAIAKSLSSLQRCTLFADLPSFASPSLITGESLRPDLVLISQDKTFYLLELTVGFETNILFSIFYCSLCQSFYGCSWYSWDFLFHTMLEETGMDKAVQRKLTMKLINIAIRCSYYIFCRRNKEWTNPDLIDF